VIGIAFELTTSCLECGAELAINALAPNIVCPLCHAVNELGMNVWEAIFTGPLDECLHMKNGEESELSVTRGKRNCELLYVRENPCDPESEMPLDISAVIAAAEKGFLTLSNGDKLSSRPAPVEYRPILENVVCLVGEDFVSPTQPVIRWYLMYDEKSDVLHDTNGDPFSWNEVGDLLIDKNGHLYLTCLENDRESVTVVSFASDLLMRWVQRDAAIPFRAYETPPRLSLAARDRLLVHCYSQDKINILSRVDGATVGKISFTGQGEGASPRVAPKLWKSIFPDTDGSLLAYFGDDHFNPEKPLNGPVRCSLNGKELPVWPQPKPADGFFRKFRRVEKGSSGAMATAFGDIGDAPEKIVEANVYISPMPDGSYLFHSYGRLARYRQDGRIIYRRQLLKSETIFRYHIDADGAVYAVVGETVIRVAPDGSTVDTVTEHVRRGGYANQEKLLAHGSDGTMYLFGDEDRVRVVAPDGKITFLSRRSRTDDKDACQESAPLDDEEEAVDENK